MATINSFFEQGGLPALGLSPTIRIWDVETSGNTLVVTDDPVSEIGDGFYTYQFTTYDPTKSYVVRVDGGLLVDSRYTVAALDAAVPISAGDVQAIVNGVWDEQAASHESPTSMGYLENQISGGIGPHSVNLNPASITSIVNGVWDEQTSNHLQAGSFGFMDQQIKADTTNISINVLDAISLVQTLLKYERNHTKIDMNLATLTVYDDDGVTPITVFRLYDQNGLSSVAQVAERVPQ